MNSDDWGFWGFVVGVLALLATVGIAIWQKRKKMLQYEILSNTALVSKAKKLEGMVKILYEDKEVNAVHLIVLKLLNAGNLSITKTDFEEPLIISFEPQVDILSADISETNPSGLKPILNIESNTIVIEPLLLNALDFLVVNILINNYASKPTIYGRIVGVKDITCWTTESRSLIEFFQPLLSIVLLMYGIAALLRGIIPEWIFSSGIILIFLGGLVFFVLRKRKKMR